MADKAKSGTGLQRAFKGAVGHFFSWKMWTMMGVLMAVSLPIIATGGTAAAAAYASQYTIGDMAVSGIKGAFNMMVLDPIEGVSAIIDNPPEFSLMPSEPLADVPAHSMSDHAAHMADGGEHAAHAHGAETSATHGEHATTETAQSGHGAHDTAEIGSCVDEKLRSFQETGDLQIIMEDSQDFNSTVHDYVAETYCHSGHS